MPQPVLGPDQVAGHLDELDSLQDEVLTQLDQLNERIEAMLREHGSGGGETIPQAA